MRSEPASQPSRSRALPIEILTREEVDRLLRACSKRAPSGVRDRALIAVLFGAGLRIAEALALRPKDIDLERGQITVLRGKGSASQASKRRVSAIGEGMGALVQLWLDARVNLRIACSAPVFCGISKGNSWSAA